MSLGSWGYVDFMSLESCCVAISGLPCFVLDLWWSGLCCLVVQTVLIYWGIAGLGLFDDMVLDIWGEGCSNCM